MLTLKDLKTHTEWKGLKQIIHENRGENKSVTILRSDNIDFKTKSVQKRRRRVLNKDKGINPTRM